MKYIKITNEGLIDKKAFTLMGASTKRSDDKKIGFFGSGLKYSIAVLLKHKNDFKIFSGLEEIKLTTKKVTFREVSFDVICINGRKTNLTTDMGPSWEEWFAIREIYCNAIDEVNHTIDVVEEIDPEENKTSFFVSITPSMEKLLNNWDNYFSSKREDLVCWNAGTRLYNSNRPLIVYRKGVQCFTSNRNSLYHYDLSWVKINESRVVEDSWTLLWDLPKKIAAMADTKVINNFFNNIFSTYEEQMCWEGVLEFNSLWLDVIGDRKIIDVNIAGYFREKILSEDCLILPSNLIRGLKRTFGDKIIVLGQADHSGEFIVIDKEPKSILLLDQCMAFFKESGFIIKYPIKIAIFTDAKTWGTTRKEEIILSTTVFDQGKKKIVETILEEVFHIESQARDCTRSFQNHLITQFVTLLEEKTKIYL